MSRFTTQLVVALSLCLVLLGFSYSAEAAARPITTAPAARVSPNTLQCDLGSCRSDDDCLRRICQPQGYGGGYCKPMASSSNGGSKIDVNRHVAYSRCCCI
ncbi:hypothetical protein MKW98_022148 [Papaver atlanticum]|uniref:Uncharacterized protein n=1 Tax=Papaver atlanticum TaxID=357466 RepID=A0AAD4T1A1_9MAGN|nr:hypothetical protein MKW98_022148 [Papaver atlanticum]